MELRIVTYNTYAGDELHNERIPHIAEEINSRRPDIILFQECTEKVVDALTKAQEMSANDVSANPAVGKVTYSTVWKKTTALADKYPGKTLEEIANQFGWDPPPPADLLKQNGNSNIHEKMPGFEELSELFVVINTEKIEIQKKELICDGNWFDDGIMKIRVAIKGSSTKVFDVFNVHFSGGSFGKPKEILLRKRAAREKEFKILNKSISDSTVVGNDVNCRTGIVVGGDFNCDVANLDLFPESKMSPEFIADFKNLNFVDVGSDLGPTESTSKNAFRKWLKPGQDREARFDRILVGRIDATVLGTQLVGDKEVGTVGHGTDKDQPVHLFPSDHFGVFVCLQV